MLPDKGAIAGVLVEQSPVLPWGVAEELSGLYKRHFILSLFLLVHLLFSKMGIMNHEQNGGRSL